MAVVEDKIAAPALPIPPNEYKAVETRQFRDILRIFFSRLTFIVNESLEFTRPNITTETGNTLVLVSEYENDHLLLDDPSPITVTLPLDDTEDLPIGYITTLHQEGVGQITCVGEVGVSVTSPIGVSSRVQYSPVTVMKIDSNSFRVTGDTV